MSVCVYSVFVLSCEQVERLRRADIPSKEPYSMCKKIKELNKREREIERERPSPTKGCKAIDR
jgi:hypothetical protein